MTPADWYWLVWLFLGFGFYEGQALARDKPQDTLTYAWCRWFALFPGDKGKPFWQIRRAFGVLFPCWLVFHVTAMTLGGLF